MAIVQSNVSLVALHTTSATAQRKLKEAGDRELLSCLALNKTLDPKVWNSIYQEANLDPQSLQCLLHNAPTAEQARVILDNQNEDLRIPVLRLGIPAMDSATKAELYATGFFDPEHAAQVLYSGDVLPGYERALVKMVLGSSLPQTLPSLYSAVMETIASNFQILNDAQLLHQLMTVSVDSYNMARIIDYRPGLIGKLLELKQPKPHEFLRAVARSQHLTIADADHLFYWSGMQNDDNLLMNLAYNPNAATELRLKIIDLIITYANNSYTLLPEYAAKVANLSDLCGALSGKNKYGTVFHEPQTPVTNPWNALQVDDLPKVKTAIEYFGFWYYPTLVKVENLN